MAERVYDDAAASERERAAAVLARWVFTTHPAELHVRYLQREVRSPGLCTAEQIREAASVLVEADWLRSRHQAPRSDSAGGSPTASTPACGR